MKPFLISKSHWTYRYMDWCDLCPWRRTDLCSYGRGLFRALVVWPFMNGIALAFLALLAAACMFLVGMTLLLPLYALELWVPDFVSEEAVYVTGCAGWGLIGIAIILLTLALIGDQLQRRRYSEPGPVGASWRAFKNKTCVPVKFD